MFIDLLDSGLISRGLHARAVFMLESSSGMLMFALLLVPYPLRRQNCIWFYLVEVLAIE